MAVPRGLMMKGRTSPSFSWSIFLYKKKFSFVCEEGHFENTMCLCDSEVHACDVTIGLSPLKCSERLHFK